MTPADQEAAELLRRATAPVIVAVNKADNEKRELEAAEFYALGWEETYAISAAHGRGTGDLLDAIVWALPPETEAGDRAQGARGRGRGLGRRGRRRAASSRTSSAPRRRRGRRRRTATTTTDAADLADDDAEAARWDAAIAAEADERAGRDRVRRPAERRQVEPAQRPPRRGARDRVRHPGHDPRRDRHAARVGPQRDRPHRYRRASAGAARSRRARRPSATRRSGRCRRSSRADVAVLVLDAVDGLTAQDAHVAGYVVEEGKGLVIAVNKWDLVAEKTDRTFDQYVEWIRNEVPFLDFAPIVSISAKTGQRVGRVLEAGGRHLGASAAQRDLDRRAQPAAARRPRERTPPPPVRGKRPKLFYATQAAVAPPTFVFFARTRRPSTSVPALPREPPARGVRVRRDADPARLPRPGLGEAAAAQEGPLGAGRRRRAARRQQRAGAGRRQAARDGRAARVAVVGAGAWGTTLAAPRRPAASRSCCSCHSPGDRGADQRDAPQRARGCRASTCPRRSSRRRIRRRSATRRTSSSSPCRRAHLRATVERVGAAPRAATPTCSPSSRASSAGTLLRMSRGHRRGRRRPTRAGSPPCPARTSPPRSPATCPHRRSSPPTDPKLAERIVERLGRREFRLYVNEDLLGVELCGALKNVIAIAAGAADGLGFGDNGKAGLMTRGLAEMTRLGIAAGANPLTFAGLAGIGDVIATCGSHAVAQPSARRGARQGPLVGRDRGVAARASPRAPTRSMRRSRSPTRHGVEMPIARRSTTRCSRARACSAA